MPSPKITGDEFFSAFQVEWRRFCSQEHITGLTPWRDGRKSWTQKMLGNPNGFFHRVMYRLIRDDRHLEYWTERYSVDALYMGGKSLHNNNPSYPLEVHALIEHEFDEDLETEMWKLLHWRAPLKVIVSYDWAEDEKTNKAKQNFLRDKIACLRDMQSRVNAFHPECSDTEYLFIMSYREMRDGKLSWIRA
ncbi:MAG: hypothetical protein IAF00_05980 [Phycisphaerales bacterium]|nr:hypothetical protein [Phycisphaerales bacterium]